MPNETLVLNMAWYLVTAGVIAYAHHAASAREALERELEAIGEIDLDTYHEIGSGDSNTGDIVVCEVTESEALLADGHGDRWPQRELRTWHFRDETANNDESFGVMSRCLLFVARMLRAIADRVDSKSK